MKFTAKFGFLPNIKNIVIVNTYPYCISFSCNGSLCEDFAEILYDELLSYGLAANLNKKGAKYVYRIYKIKF